MLKYMVPQNWLLNYAKFDGLRKVFRGMANRTKFDSKLENAVEDLEENYELFQEEFTSFFPDLKDFVSKRIQTI